MSEIPSTKTKHEGILNAVQGLHREQKCLNVFVKSLSGEKELDDLEPSFVPALTAEAEKCCTCLVGMLDTLQGELDAITKALEETRFKLQKDLMG